MKPRSAVLGSIVFFVVAPVVVSGLVPWAISGWRAAEALPGWWPVVAVLGGVLIAAGVASLVSAFARFVTEGRGTPAPVAPTSALVIGSQFAWVRNPMYLANISAILGQAAVLGRWRLREAVRGADAGSDVRHRVRRLPASRTWMVAAPVPASRCGELTRGPATPRSPRKGNRRPLPTPIRVSFGWT